MAWLCLPFEIRLICLTVSLFPRTLEVPQRLKARHMARTSVLDTVLGQMKNPFEKNLGHEDRQRIADYQESVRQVEQQLQRDYAWSKKDKPRKWSRVKDWLNLSPKPVPTGFIL